jgi:3-oxoacyl-[acyl-carrier protein] reductase
VHAWFKGLSRDVGKHGITLHCVQPGLIMSEQVVASDPTEEAWRAFAQREIPIGRFGNPKALADVVASLASPRTNYMTGTVIPVDGGIKRFAY